MSPSSRFTFGNRNVSPVICRYLKQSPCEVDAPAQLHWSFYSVANLSFASRLVLLRASRSAWDEGQSAIQEAIKGIAERNWHDFCLTQKSNSSAAESIIPSEPQSIWVLSSPDDVHSFIFYDESMDRFFWEPVFSLDPAFARGSRRALATIFPESALAGLSYLDELNKDSKLHE